MRKALSVGSIILLTVALAFGLTTGPNLPTAATGNTSVIGGGNVVWGTPTNIELADGSNAVNTLPGNGTGTQISDDLIGTGFAFAIASTDTINGILLEVNVRQSIITGGGALENSVRLLRAGVASGTDKSTGAQPGTALAIVSYGGAADSWGTTWAPADINNPNFGAAVSYQNPNVTTSRTVSVDFFRITITSTPAASTKSGFLQLFGFKSDQPKTHTQTRIFRSTRG